ncbi:MAG: hypothetical protein JOY54_17340 [Acidobacteriaceae bacterium]|nr:hypothetical protein [Acidobacteriaceae bacterium]
MSEHSFLPSLILFVIATGLVARSMWTRRSIGLGGVYMLQLWILYASGACLRALPWAGLRNTSVALDGFAVSAYGAIAFAAGWCIRPYLFPLRSPRFVKQNPKLPGLYIASGLISYFLLKPTIGRLPTLQAITLVGAQLALAGLCLGAFLNWQRGGWKLLLKWSLPALLFPLVTVLHQGFLGYGVAALSMFAVFCATFVRPRWVVVVALVLAVYSGTSFTIAYLKNRPALRTAVWGGADWRTRIDELAKTVSIIEPFDVRNRTDIEIFNERMDQSPLLGLAVDRLSERGDYAHGETLLNALIGLVPRALWPNKPVGAGSGGLVSRYTGLHFARNTSVGVGQMMELYINFGTASVVVGLLVLGLLLGYSDEKAALLLHSGNWPYFVQWFLFGISFLQVGGSLIEAVSTAGASVATGHIVNSIIAARARAAERKKIVPAGELQAV